MKRYTMTKLRQIAIGATRSYIRQFGNNPTDYSAEQAYAYLDGLCTAKPDLLAASWWRNASEHQYKLFCREWRKQCKDIKQRGGS